MFSFWITYLSTLMEVLFYCVHNSIRPLKSCFVHVNYSKCSSSSSITVAASCIYISLPLKPALNNLFNLNLPAFFSMKRLTKHLLKIATKSNNSALFWCLLYQIDWIGDYFKEWLSQNLLQAIGCSLSSSRVCSGFAGTTPVPSSTPQLQQEPSPSCCSEIL